MPTNRTRTPREQSKRVPITAKALEAFGRMEELKWQCTCRTSDRKSAFRKEHGHCPACQGWDDNHWILFCELKCKPWEYYCIEEPEGDEPDSQWRRLARERYRVLDAALRAQRRGGGSTSPLSEPAPMAAAPPSEE